MQRLLGESTRLGKEGEEFRLNIFFLVNTPASVGLFSLNSKLVKTLVVDNSAGIDPFSARPRPDDQ